MDSLAKNILVFRIGSLGDTLVAVPALWVVREEFPAARITLLCDRQPDHRVLASDVLDGSGTIDEYMMYPSGGSSYRRSLEWLRLWWRLRRQHFDAMIYLAPSRRSPAQERRDRLFFRSAGIRHLVGARFHYSFPTKQPGQPLPVLPREGDLLLARLAASGIPVPTCGHGKTDVGPGNQAELQQAIATRQSDGGRAWIALGPGSKMPSKIWPIERYCEVMRRLVEQFDVWPVILGGPEDAERGESLVNACGRGYQFAGVLSLRGSLAALHRCRLYLGNDTGTMHMAAAAHVPCVAIFSARDMPGMWYPYGEQHKIFRTTIDCEGCLLEDCVERKMECLCRIGVEEVFEACAQVLRKSALSTTDRRENQA